METNSPPPPKIQIQQSADEEYTIVRSQPDEIIRHDISDEELTTLSDHNVGFLSQGLWVAIGVFIGALPKAATAFYQNNEQIFEAKTQPPT